MRRPGSGTLRPRPIGDAGGLPSVPDQYDPAPQTPVQVPRQVTNRQPVTQASPADNQTPGQAAYQQSSASNPAYQHPMAPSLQSEAQGYSGYAVDQPQQIPDQYSGQQRWQQPVPSAMQQTVADPYLETQQSQSNAQAYDQQQYASPAQQTPDIDPLAAGGYDDYSQQYAPDQRWSPQTTNAPATANYTQQDAPSNQDSYSSGISPIGDEKGILAAATDSDAKIDAAEEKAVENIEKRDLRDVRDVRRGRKSKLRPNAAVDARKQAKTIRGVTLFLICAMLALAVFNVVIPKKQWSQTEIQSIAKIANGDTGFPMQEGMGVATQFMQAYLESGSESTASNQMLQVFYNGQTYADVTNQDGGDGSGTPNNMQIPTDIVTKIEAGPYVYESKPVAADGKSATYRVGALVYRQNATNNTPVFKEDGKTVDYKWVFYQVDLFYDSKTTKFAVSKNSPVRVTEPATGASSIAPEAQLPGNGQEIDEMQNDDMQKLVTQFFTSWAASDQTALSVMIDKKQSLPSVTQGLNGDVTLAGDPSYKIYGPPSGDSYYRALVTVTWKEQVTTESAYTQTSTYILKLKKDGSKFYVIDVQPYLYIPQKASSDGGSSTGSSESGDNDASK